MSDQEIKTELRRVDPRQLKRRDVNARYMAKETFDRLVRQVERDGCLTSVPLVWEMPNGTLEIISGHHRTEAAIVAGIREIDVMIALGEHSRDELVSRQLAHNAIEGQDDAATLKRMYEEIEDVDWRDLAGLDDAQLKLLAQVNLDSVGEANLEFATLQITFLPSELERAKEQFEEATALAKTDARWVAAVEQYDPVLDALSTVHSAYDVTNVASALSILLGVFESHLEELRDGWYNERAEQPNHKGRAPMETVFGERTMPAEAAVEIQRAITKAVERGDCDPHRKWTFISLLCADYLAGA